MLATADVKPMLPFLQPETLPNQIAKQIEAQKSLDKYNFFGKPSSTPVAQTTQQGQNLNLMGYLTVKNKHENIPEFKICFNGKYTYTNKEGFFTIPVDEGSLGKYSLLICKNFNQDFMSINTIDHLNVNPKKNYKYYTFKRLGSGQWIQKEKHLDKKKFSVPQNCVILTIDPKYVDHVESWQILLPANYLKLPKIVLKDSPKLEHESKKSLLYTLDSKPFNRNATAETHREASNPKVQVLLVK
jgi:hydroxymethylpyrimidine pyrophosphatase-like HAD family hydrolase